MDPGNIDIDVLARQLRKPEGEMGKEVGKLLAQKHVEQIAFIFENLEVQPDDHVLEIGFGPGEGIAEAVRLTPQGYVAGIDYSEVMLRMAEGRNHRAVMQEHVELVLGDAKELPYGDESFDKVFSLNVFHFWADPSRELAECRRVLKPGGRLLFYLTHPSSWLPGLGGSGVFIAREPEEVAALFTQAGFRDVTQHLKEFDDRKGFVVMGIK